MITLGSCAALEIWGGLIPRWWNVKADKLGVLSEIGAVKCARAELSEVSIWGTILPFAS